MIVLYGQTPILIFLMIIFADTWNLICQVSAEAAESYCWLTSIKPNNFWPREETTPWMPHLMNAFQTFVPRKNWHCSHIHAFWHLVRFKSPQSVIFFSVLVTTSTTPGAPLLTLMLWIFVGAIALGLLSSFAITRLSATCLQDIVLIGRELRKQVCSVTEWFFGIPVNHISWRLAVTKLCPIATSCHDEKKVDWKCMSRVQQRRNFATEDTQLALQPELSEQYHCGRRLCR